jgi:formylglycine-generating enzyme required for sulfatase activity
MKPFIIASCSVSIISIIVGTSADDYSAKNTDIPFTDLVLDASSANRCPENMVEVEGNYCPSVEQKCLRWLDADQSPTANGGIGPMRCAEFQKPSKCLSAHRKHLDFCMAKFEYPGTEGSYPLVGINYYQAKAMAEKDGNRLCTKEEFNFAGEGEDMKPYSYGDGFHRDATICNIDKPWIDYTKFPQSVWNDPDGGLYQAVKSDSNSKCVSEFSIYNLNGNVDEILNSEGHNNVILSGGYWAKVRDRMRPQTVSHGKDFAFYQIGFRECKDIK